jgi:hypothetical protein
MVVHRDLVVDAPSNFLKDSNVSTKVKTIEKRVGVRSLTHNGLGSEGRAGTLGWGLGQVTRESIIHMDLHKPNNKLIVHSWSTFSAQTNHMHTWTHKIHHGLNLVGATTFPLLVLFLIN